MPVRKRVLIVDDDEAVLLVLRDILAELCDSLEIVACVDPVEAMGRIEAEHFDLVLTDLRMPEVDGVALTRAVRKASEDVDENRATVVIWLTAYGSEETREIGRRLDVYRVLDKPLEVGEIQAIVRDALGHADEGKPCSS